MIEKLGINQQVFITTNNMDILDITLPNHSYSFFKLDEYNKIISVCIDSYIKKNDRSIRNIIENDRMGTLADESKLNDL